MCTCPVDRAENRARLLKLGNVSVGCGARIKLVRQFKKEEKTERVCEPLRNIMEGSV